MRYGRQTFSLIFTAIFLYCRVQSQSPWHGLLAWLLWRRTHFHFGKYTCLPFKTKSWTQHCRLHYTFLPFRTITSVARGWPDWSISTIKPTKSLKIAAQWCFTDMFNHNPLTLWLDVYDKVFISFFLLVPKRQWPCRAAGWVALSPRNVREFIQIHQFNLSESGAL